MVRDALTLAAVYKQAEADTMAQLAPGGVLLPVEAVADAKERLAFWRGAVVSLILSARESATEEERRELSAVLLVLVNSPFGAF